MVPSDLACRSEHCSADPVFLFGAVYLRYQRQHAEHDLSRVYFHSGSSFLETEDKSNGSVLFNSHHDGHIPCHPARFLFHLGLLSGIVAAFAIITLSMARKYDSTIIIVFYLMAIGFLTNGLAMIPVFTMPEGVQYFHLVASGVFGAMGQVLLTMGYKSINAKTGSMISSSRIVFASLLGFFIFAEPMTPLIIVGGLIIVGAIIGVSRLHYR
jgi:drug/metabolite transporter (DMT)-like permease